MGAGRESMSLPLTLDKLVGAFCADYGRRREAISEGSVGIRTEMEYKYLNHRIFEGAAEIVGSELAELYIDEIGRNVGYANSKNPASCEAGYKREKREVKLSIARKLHLV
jgi:hypothetical protein